MAEKGRTVREIMREKELERRSVAATTTKHDAPATILRQGTKIIIPEAMTPDKVLATIRGWVEGEEKSIAINSVIEGVPIDAAHALQQSIMEELGVTDLRSTPGFFGATPPTFRAIPIDHRGNTTDVYVGRMALAGLDDAWIESSPSDDQMRLNITASVKKKEQELLNQILDRARHKVKADSLYKGKAFELDLGAVDSEGNALMIVPKFWDIEERKTLILNADAQRLVEATLWAPILKAELLRKRGKKIKRGILFNGHFGTGKTLCAYITAQQAVSAGFTFAYVKSVAKLAQAFEFMQRNLAPGVIFCEDMDRAFEDPAKINEIQNTLDGIDSKNSEVIIVLTTNYIEQIPPGTVRPGRIDTVINLKAPDADSAARLIRTYGEGILADDVDIEEVGRAVAGNIPAVIKEVVERAELYALAEADDENIKLRTVDLLAAIHGMEESGHIALLNKGGAEFAISPLAAFGYSLGQMIGQNIKEAIADGMADLVNGKASAGDSSATGGRKSGKDKIKIN